MSNRIDRVHSAFESLKAAIRSRRHAVAGRPACFATNEQLSALGMLRPGNRMSARGDCPFDLR